VIDFQYFFAVCKSAGNAYGGSNPPAPTKTRKTLKFQWFPGFFVAVFRRFFCMAKVQKSEKKCNKIHRFDGKSDGRNF